MKTSHALLLAAFLATTALVILVVDERESPVTVTETQTVPTVTATDAHEEVIDSDGDGLKDWEEALWATDPKNPDTDGDGTGDGDESRDELARLAATMRPAANEEFTMAIATTKPASKPTVIAPAKNETESPEKAALRTYGNAVAGIVAKASVELRAAKESETFTALIKDPKPENFDALLIVADSYSREGVEITALQSPSGLKGQALALSASYENLAWDIRGLAALKNEGRVTTARFKTYNGYAAQAGKDLLALGAAIRNAGVSFAASEPGYMFMFDF